MMLGVKLLGGIKSIYVDSLACVRVKEGESERRLPRLFYSDDLDLYGESKKDLRAMV